MDDCSIVSMTLALWKRTSYCLAFHMRQTYSHSFLRYVLVICLFKTIKGRESPHVDRYVVKVIPEDQWSCKRSPGA